MNEKILQTLQELKAMVALLLGGASGKTWFTTQEFGLVTGWSTYSVREYCRQGFLEAHKRPGGGQWIISAQEMERFLREGLRTKQQQS
jgi:hypothetical protein